MSMQAILEKILRGEALTDAEQTAWSNHCIAPSECPSRAC